MMRQLVASPGRQTCVRSARWLEGSLFVRGGTLRGAYAPSPRAGEMSRIFRELGRSRSLDEILRAQRRYGPRLVSDGDLARHAPRARCAKGASPARRRDVTTQARTFDAGASKRRMVIMRGSFDARMARGRTPPAHGF
jgi:hypothetical protein